MNSLRFSADPRTVLIADASVVINLNATGRAADIIRAFPNRFAVTANACAELDDGAQHGHDDARQLHDLIAADIVQRVEVGPLGGAIYEALIDGSARLTLDDGEAATIACAIELAGVALLDERKARSLCAASFAALRLGSTAQLLMHDAVVAALGAHAQIEALVMALKQGRMRVPPEYVAEVTQPIGMKGVTLMRVPPEYVAEVTALIGPRHAAGCASLPKAARVADLG